MNVDLERACFFDTNRKMKCVVKSQILLNSVYISGCLLRPVLGLFLCSIDYFVTRIQHRRLNRKDAFSTATVRMIGFFVVKNCCIAGLLSDTNSNVDYFLLPVISLNVLVVFCDLIQCRFSARHKSFGGFICNTS